MRRVDEALPCLAGRRVQDAAAALLRSHLLSRSLTAEEDAGRVDATIRSSSNPGVVTVQEGWTTEEDHHRIFGGAAAQAIVAQFADILADKATYDDFIAVDGKANY